MAEGPSDRDPERKRQEESTTGVVLPNDSALQQRAAARDASGVDDAALRPVGCKG